MDIDFSLSTGSTDLEVSVFGKHLHEGKTNQWQNRWGRVNCKPIGAARGAETKCLLKKYYLYGSYGVAVRFDGMTVRLWSAVRRIRSQ